MAAFDDPDGCCIFIRQPGEYRNARIGDSVRHKYLIPFRIVGDSAGITESDLDQVYGRLFGTNGEAAPDGTLSVVDLVHKTAAECLKADEGINFENKIVLSIAVRLGAERFMVTKISDAAFVASIDANQTPALLMKFRETFPKSAAIATLARTTRSAASCSAK